LKLPNGIELEKLNDDYYISSVDSKHFLYKISAPFSLDGRYFPIKTEDGTDIWFNTTINTKEDCLKTAHSSYLKNDLILSMNQVIQGDCLEVMKTLEDNSIDLTVTSPPYDNLRKYNGYTFDFEGIAKELFRVTKQGGVVVWVVGDATIKGSETGTSFKQALYFKEIGFNLHDTMIWNKINPVPLTHNRYEQGFEFMFILSKGKPNTVNHIREVSTCIQTRTRRKSNKEGGSAFRSREEYTTTNPTKIKTNVWGYTNTNKKINHPAIFPEKLAEDHILSWSNSDDVVMDCLAGSGTTGIMAHKNGRKFILIETSETYCDIIKERFKSRFNLDIKICH